MNGRRGAPFHDPARPETQGQDDWLLQEEAEMWHPPLVPGSMAYVPDEHGYGCDCDWCR